MPETVAATVAYVSEAFAGEAAVTGAADVAASAGVAGGTAASGGGALAASGSYAAGTEALFGAGGAGGAGGAAGAAGSETLGGAFLKSAAQAGGAGAVSSLLTPRPQRPNVAPITPMADPLAQEQARKNALMEQISRRGRASTIMTQPNAGGLLGG